VGNGSACTVEGCNFPITPFLVHSVLVTLRQTQITRTENRNITPSYHLRVACDFLFGTSAPFSWRGFWWLFRQTFEFVHVGRLLSLTLVLAANLLVALIHDRPFHAERWKREYWLVFLSLFFIPATIAIGTVGWIDPALVPRPEPSALLVWTNNGLFIVSILLGIFWVYRMKGLRWFALAFALVQLWILFFAGFVAGMAITGDWL
jgi:hypothetical protein